MDSVKDKGSLGFGSIVHERKTQEITSSIIKKPPFLISTWTSTDLNCVIFSKKIDTKIGKWDSRKLRDKCVYEFDTESCWG